MQLKDLLKKSGVVAALCLSIAGTASAQQMDDTTKPFVPSGKLWGYAFGDLAYKGSSDANFGTAAAPVYRGGSNQYTGMPANANMFQWRRIYLGYNYDISKKFSAEFLLAAEDDFNAGLDNQGAGDVVANGKFAPYVKLANIRWKNIFKNSDFVFGQVSTPSFAKTGRNDQTAEEVWGYRSIERTVSDIRRTPSFDFGMSLQGWFDKDANFGYDVMVSNGTGAKVAGNTFKWFSGDVWAKFMDKKIIIDLYQDYERLAWGTYVAGITPGTSSLNGPLYSDRNMTKLFAAYTTKKLTIGFEGFRNTIMGGNKVTGFDKYTYYRTEKEMDFSVYVKGRIKSRASGDPMLGFFARYDNYDPSGNLSNVLSDANTKSYSNVGVAQYEPTTKEQFVTFGLDFQPIKNVHIMPNVWMNTYNSAIDVTGSNKQGTKYSTMNSFITGIKGTDAVYRLTFYYIYGK